MKALILFFCSTLCFGQLKPSVWFISTGPGYVPATTLTCLDPQYVGVSPSGNAFINIELHPETCHDTNLDGTTRTTLTSAFTAGNIFTTSFNFLYGTIDFRAKFAAGNRTWDAIWLYDAASCQAAYQHSTQSCPGAATPVPEIDMAEIVNGSTIPVVNINQQIHTSDGHNDLCTGVAATDITTNFHVYQVVWTPGSLVFKIDGTTTCTITQSYVPSTAMFLLVDLITIGGSSGTTGYPANLLVDYIKVTCAASTVTPACSAGTVIFDEEFGSAPATTSGGQVLGSGQVTVQ